MVNQEVAIGRGVSCGEKQIPGITPPRRPNSPCYRSPHCVPRNSCPAVVPEDNQRSQLRTNNNPYSIRIYGVRTTVTSCEN